MKIQIAKMIARENAKLANVDNSVYLCSGRAVKACRHRCPLTSNKKCATNQ